MNPVPGIKVAVGAHDVRARPGHAHRALAGRDVVEVAERADGDHGRDGQVELLADLDGPLAFLDVEEKLGDNLDGNIECFCFSFFI